MATTRLDLLPGELIAHIAARADAFTVVQLSETCRATRKACWNCVVLREVLQSSGSLDQKSETLRLVEATAGKEVNIWARYALADQQASKLAKVECPLETPPAFIDWLPELLVVKHSFVKHQCWSRFLRDGPTQLTRQVFCQAIAILSSSEDMPQLARSLAMQEDPILTRKYEGPKTFLWVLCSVALIARTAVRNREAAWPYNAAAQVPHIAPPKAAQIPLDLHVNPPLPFAEPGSWNNWYKAYNLANLHDQNYFTSSAWCGYYTHFGMQARYQDPPMLNIRFQTPQIQLEGESHVRSHIIAPGCHDGVGAFTIHNVRILETEYGEVVFRALKAYTNNWSSWHWDLRVTPFGLLGFWGTNTNSIRSGFESDPGFGINRMGMVWLWKEEWTR
ncbi:hypothetical protein BAUCODRAFT_29429 [Baudoinia panamericana UAMH 10762]|uniref:F-box domain-containing protein n=1 Tax=Baudoinia panamericana (strain UAMH 10762) TaxID=717646 RepID=M2M1W5_BAUPA|nr:uncharacterized protein BAUCODRAFT_29429 [Baudoinia panamericana UAMH 10762]EMD01048.1 hypothetical protein BAUCODRAFT_29429 [Baudoinia panamericana UAMH 10762]